jgi:UDP-N-acetylglucosamine acyltransferase
MVGGMTKITQDCPPYMLVDGNPASVYGVNRIGMERRNVAPRSRELLKDAYRILYRQDLSTTQALARIRADVESCPEIEKLIGFVERSERGIIK